MKIVTDSAVDLPEEMFSELGIERMPLLISFGTQTYRSGGDIQPEEFYRRLAASHDQLPTTSQPSVGEFVDLYRRVGQSDKEIVSVHISSGLSGTFNSASQAAQQCPDLKDLQAEAVEAQLRLLSENFAPRIRAIAPEMIWRKKSRT